MIFPKKDEKVLSEDLFRNPTSEYRAAPFWAWNTKLDAEEMAWQLDIFKKMGVGGAHLHVRTGMETPYLSREHMDMVKLCVEKCRQEGMLAWLYDEDRWPSGVAGGLITKEEKNRAKYLLFTPNPYTPDSKPYISGLRGPHITARANNGYLLACYDVVLDENGCLQSAKRIDEAQQAKGTKWYAYVETMSPSPWFQYGAYADTLSRETMAEFIDVTYEPYRKTVGKDFGGIVPAMFTDEPQIVGKKGLDCPTDTADVFLPWTECVPETYREAYGEDILEKLPELLWELPDGKVSTTRYHYHDHICELFVSSFLDQCGDWCQKNGLTFTGHVMSEATLVGQTKAQGDTMRSYRSFQLPGTDMLCNKTEYTTAKQAQSAARQYGREGTMCECYGVTGWDCDFRTYKFQGDWLAAQGVVVRVPHLSFMSMKGEAKRDFPASIFYQSPWWQDYAQVEDHYARLATALVRGKPQVRLGVVHPIESLWLRFGPTDQTDGYRKQLDRNFQDLTQWLLMGNVDFDFISESLLPEQCAQGGAPLQVGQMAYDMILVPGCETLRSTTLERLELFQREGGQLVFLGDAPKFADAGESDRPGKLWEKAQHIPFAKNDVLDAVEPVRTVKIVGKNRALTENLMHQLRKDGEDLWLFVAHGQMPGNRDVPVCQEVTITVPGVYGVLRYDSQIGEILPMTSEIVGGKTIVKTQLYDLDSLLLRYTAPENVPVAEKKAMSGNESVLPLPQQVAYRLDEPNVLLLDKAEYGFAGEEYAPETELLRADNALRQRLAWPLRSEGSAQPWSVSEQEAPRTARLRFRIFCTQTLTDVKLALEEAENTKIYLNGQCVSAKPQGWYVDKAIGTVLLGALQAGENVLELETPFSHRIGLEWCYLLGDFDVQVFGEHRRLTPKAGFLGFGDVTGQGLAHYGGNITYSIPVKTGGGKLSVTVPHYAGAGLRCRLNGEQKYILYPPYRTAFDSLPAGEHTLEITLLGNRQNSFGPVHRADLKNIWINPTAWRSTGASWTESYRLRELGILSAPVLAETCPEG
ncbi:MAG: hypothetical protein IKJ94_07115 [Oscillospiraceae bacterium]|nr:hypothetical protein [Oscillospiraceae bacterium]